jgi:MFS family permease
LKVFSQSQRYESFVILLAALLNSVAGIVIDLYAPCLPAIARELNVSVMMMQNTITLSIIGYAVGQIVFGILCDWKGRKISIILGLTLFTFASVCASMTGSIEMLMICRILQGFSAGSCQVIARAILIDNVKGPKFTIGIVYLSTAFALGLILGPYIGAEIQQILSWRWNFIFYAFYACILLLIVLFGMRESLSASVTPNILSSYKQILSHPVFISSFLQLGCCFIAFTLWNQIGPFIVENNLHKTATYFGLIALSAGIAYLLGTLINRLLIHRVTLSWRLNLSLCLFLCGIVILAMGGGTFSLYYLFPGLLISTFSQGIAFPNVLSQAMSLFPDKAGISASIQGAGMLVIGFLGLSLVSLIEIKSSLMMSLVYAVLFIIFVSTKYYITMQLSVKL